MEVQRSGYKAIKKALAGRSTVGFILEDGSGAKGFVGIYTVWILACQGRISNITGRKDPVSGKVILKGKDFDMRTMEKVQLRPNGYKTLVV